MNTARILKMAPFRATAMRQPVIRQAFMRQARPFHNTRTMLRTKEEEHSAHTISQRIRQLKKIPPELLPLAVVLAFALFAAGFSMTRKLFTDKTLRLHRNPPKAH